MFHVGALNGTKATCSFSAQAGTAHYVITRHVHSVAINGTTISSYMEHIESNEQHDQQRKPTNMTRLCNFPISRNGRCTQPVADGRPNCGRHKTNMSADQLGDYLMAYEKGGEIHVWYDVPDGPYCMIHNDPTYLASYEAEGKKPPCCLKERLVYYEICETGERDYGYVNVTHRDDGPAVINPDGSVEWYWQGDEYESQEEYEEARDRNDWNDYGGASTGAAGRRCGIYDVSGSQYKKHW